MFSRDNHKMPRRLCHPWSGSSFARPSAESVGVGGSSHLTRHLITQRPWSNDFRFGAKLHHPPFHFAEAGDPHAGHAPSVQSFLDPGAGMPPPFTDPASLPSGKPDGDADRAAAFLDGERVAHVVLEAEVRRDLIALVEHAGRTHARQREVAHFRASMVERGQVPVPLEVEDAVRFHLTIECLATTEA